MMRAVCAVLIFGLGCNLDHGFGRAVPRSQAGVPDVDLSVDIAFQRGRWGDMVGRCHLQMALRTFEPRDGEMVPYTEGNDNVIVLPEEADTCAYSTLDSQVDSVEVGSETDNWQIAGEMVAADHIRLESKNQTIILDRVEVAEGQVRYEWLDCDESTFPFGQVFDFELPDDSEMLVPGFVVEEAFVVGTDVDLVTPHSPGDEVLHSAADVLSASWQDVGVIPDVGGEVPTVERIIWVRNRRVDEQMPFEALGCAPAGMSMDVSEEDLAQLEPNLGVEEEVNVLGFQLDTVVTSPAFEAPWGQTIHVRSTVSDGGDIHLYTDE
ncbi:MAG: hypothetical protein ACPGTU_10600 [Myxococcota bacterium]